MVYQWCCEECGAFNIYIEICSTCGHHQPHKVYVTTWSKNED